MIYKYLQQNEGNEGHFTVSVYAIFFENRGYPKTDCLHNHNKQVTHP